MAPAISMKHPVCLIKNINGQLKINEEAMQILSSISQPVVVVAIVGKYRTGKSYLMNKLAGQKTGFTLGSTIQSKTKGIWMWCVSHPLNNENSLILLDTEGLGDVEKGDSKNDAWIFSLAVLMSSNLVINSMGTIDQQALDQIHYVTELTKRIQLKSSPKEAEDETGEFKRVFPSFTWCVRDFSLILKRDDKEITEDEYLMGALRLKKGKTQDIEDYNLPRICILRFFHSHKCFVFDRPTSRKYLQHLDELEEDKLEEEFVEQAQRFCSYMFQEGRIKTLQGGHKVTGRSLATLTASYVKAIQDGSIPCMENAVLALAETENAAAVQSALSIYEAEMKLMTFPTETYPEFLNHHKESEKKALEVFLQSSFKDENKKYQQKLKEQLEKTMSYFSQCNEKASADLCTALIQELSVTMEERISQGKFSKPGGHKSFLAEKVKLLEAYNSKPGKGVKANEVLQNFLSDKKAVENAILIADETITENERQIAEQQAQSEAAEREKQILEEKNKHIEQLMEDQMRSFEQQEKMLQAKMEQDMLNLKKENQWLIEQKQREQEMMRLAECHAKVQMLEQEMANLRRSRSTCVIS